MFVGVLYPSRSFSTKAGQAQPDLSLWVSRPSSDLFRMSFTHGQEASICLWREELAILNAYLNVEQVRFPEHLNWSVDVDAPDEAPFPAFLLQPLVENAVHHGIWATKSRGFLHVEGNYQKGRWQLSITNSLAGSATPTIEKGHALWTIRERLKLLNGHITLLAENGVFRVDLQWRDETPQ